MASYTPNIGLHQWVAGDKFLRTDFNTDFQKIDTAVKNAVDAASAKARAATGSYTGNGAASRTIDLGFRPKAVLVENTLGSRYGSNSAKDILGGLAVDGFPLFYGNIDSNYDPTLEIVSNGFQVRLDGADHANMNANGSTYHYLAVA